MNNNWFYKDLESMIEILGITYITQKEASKRYGYSSSWFQMQRHKKLPPVYVRICNKGKVLYPLKETDKWFEENIIRSEDFI